MAYVTLDLEIPSYTHVDNYCHGLIIAEKQIYENSPYLGALVGNTEYDQQT